MLMHTVCGGWTLAPSPHHLLDVLALTPRTVIRRWINSNNEMSHQPRKKKKWALVFCTLEFTGVVELDLHNILKMDP